MTPRANPAFRARPRHTLPRNALHVSRAPLLEKRIARCLLLAICFFLFAPAFVFSEIGCKKQETPPQKVAPLEPIPAPSGLLADVFVPSPDQAWAKIRKAVAGPALFLPAATSNLAITLLGLPLAASAEIDGNVPLVGALLAREPAGRPRAAMGLHVRDAARLIDILVKGEAARFKTAIDEKTSITLLELKDGAPRPMVIGLLGNYLLVAEAKADLLDIGPYVARTLPSAKMPEGDIVFQLGREALGGPIANGLRSSWDTLRPRARGAKADPQKGASSNPGEKPPPLPSPLTGLVDGLLGLLGDLDEAKIKLDFDDRAMHLRFLGKPRPGSPGEKRIADMTVADPASILELPADADIAIFSDDKLTSRTADAKKYAIAVADSIDKNMEEPDRAAISAALLLLAEGRGDSFTVGLSLLSTGPAVYARSDSADKEKLDRAIVDFLDLTKRRSVAVWLDENKIKVTSKKTVIENLPGDVRRIRLERLRDKNEKDDKKDKGQKRALDIQGVPKSIDILYMFEKNGDQLVLAAGYEAKKAFRDILDSPKNDNLSGRIEVKAALQDLQGKVSFLALVDPIRLLNRRAGKSELGPSAPITLALGKGGDSKEENIPWLRLDIANLAIQELIKRRGAL